MYNFTRFTRWPGQKDLENAESIVLGVLGESPFGNAIREVQTSLAKGGEKNIKVVFYGPYHEGMDLTGSHLLFISSSERGNLKRIVAGLKQQPVLTVSDTEGFLAVGGMISLVLLENRVRWEINRKAIEAAGIKVSAKLLQLAIKIENTPDQSWMKRFHRNNGNRLPMWQSIFAFLPDFLGNQV